MSMTRRICARIRLGEEPRKGFDDRLGDLVLRDERRERCMGLYLTAGIGAGIFHQAQRYRQALDLCEERRNGQSVGERQPLDRFKLWLEGWFTFDVFNTVNRGAIQARSCRRFIQRHAEPLGALPLHWGAVAGAAQGLPDSQKIHCVIVGTP